MQFGLDSATFTAYIERTINGQQLLPSDAKFCCATRNLRMKRGHMENLVLEAIENKRLIEFYYNNLPRIIEAHVYGITNGMKQVLGYQTEGQSSKGGLPDWRRFDLAEMSDLVILAQTFPGRRPVPSGRHSVWDMRIAVVD